MNVIPQVAGAAPPDLATPLTQRAPILAGVLRRRDEMPAPAGYAVFDCETTGVDPGTDEIVSFALVLLDPNGVETQRFASLVRPSRSIPAAASSVHGIHDADVADAPAFAQLSERLLGLLGDRVFVAHNASFDLGLLQPAFESAGLDYRPASVACTLDAFRVLEPLADSHRLVDICKRYGIELADVHEALGDVLATAALVRVLLEKGLAPESARLDLDAFMRFRSRGDTRPASEPQIRRVFGLARSAGLTGPDGRADRVKICELVHHITGVDEPDRLNREQVQNVYDELERLIEHRKRQAVT
jgi:DNA polymerase III epsilon subunit family exonuclease